MSFLEAGAQLMQLTKIKNKEWVCFNWEKEGPMLNTESDEFGKISADDKRKEEKM